MKSKQAKQQIKEAIRKNPGTQFSHEKTPKGLEAADNAVKTPKPEA